MHKFAAILCVTGVTLMAQWPNHPAPEVPKTPDGKVNLSAPAPRTADGKPDLSGVWKTARSFLLDAAPDLKPEDVQPWAAAIYKQSAENYRNNTDGINCLPPGPKASISNGGGYPMKIVQTPNLILVLYEYETIFRQIFTDGRDLPPSDANPTWMGYSIGHWEGDTLVVTTAGYNDRTSLDLGGHPHSESLRLTERFHRRDYGHADLQVTVEDPKAYKRSWTLPVNLELVDGDLIEYVCENERDKQHMVGKRGDEFHVAPEVLAQYVGMYETPQYPTGVIVTLDGDHLTIDPGGAGRIPLVAQSENTFSMEGNIVEFVKDANGKVTGVVQHWTEGDRYARRK